METREETTLIPGCRQAEREEGGMQGRKGRLKERLTDWKYGETKVVKGK